MNSILCSKCHSRCEELDAFCAECGTPIQSSQTESLPHSQPGQRHEHIRFFAIFAIAVVVLGSIIFLHNHRNFVKNVIPAQRESEDVVFARTAYFALSQGDPAVEKLIDWDNFVYFGEPVGAFAKLYSGFGGESYQKILREIAKQYFHQDFQNVTLTNETNWRDYPSVPGLTTTTVAVDADLSIGTSFRKVNLLFTIIRKNGERKLLAINLKTEPRP